MTLYEIVFIARQDMAPSQVDSITEHYSKLIKKSKGTVVKTEYCGLRLLSYPIKKNSKGHYVLLGVKAFHDTIKEAERQMGLSNDIIRHFSVKVDFHKDGPSSLLKSSRNSNIREVSITLAEEKTPTNRHQSTAVKE